MLGFFASRRFLIMHSGHVRGRYLRSAGLCKGLLKYSFIIYLLCCCYSVIMKCFKGDDLLFPEGLGSRLIPLLRLEINDARASSGENYGKINQSIVKEKCIYKIHAVLWKWWIQAAKPTSYWFDFQRPFWSRNCKHHAVTCKGERRRGPTSPVCAPRQKHDKQQTHAAKDLPSAALMSHCLYYCSFFFVCFFLEIISRRVDARLL